MNHPAPGAAHRAPSLGDVNRRFYDRLWADARLARPERFNTWPLLRRLALGARRRLEVAPGLRPRLPIAGTCFVDLSLPPLPVLRRVGGCVASGLITALPLANAAFDLVAAFDVVEHVEDDAAALAELARVAAPGGTLLLSVPLHQAAWTPFDAQVGHARRYEPAHLLALLADAGFTVRQSAVFGMQPRSPRLVALGMRFLQSRRTRAMWWYNRVFMPLGLLLAPRLRLRQGFVVAPGIDTVLLVCSKAEPIEQKQDACG